MKAGEKDLYHSRPGLRIMVNELKPKERRGRPVGSVARRNIIDILSAMGKGYGYEIYSVYSELFPKVTMRLIYYHLKKGVQLGEIRLHSISKEKGDYSWGNVAEKVYYTVGQNATPKQSRRIKACIQKMQERPRRPGNEKDGPNDNGAKNKRIKKA